MDGKSHLFLEVSNQEAGWISVFDTPCPGPAFSGLWYEGIPLKIEAHANPGWKFVGWQGNHQSEETSIDFSFMGNSNLYAGFEPRELPSIVINEIHYNPSKDLQGADEEFEFLELLNYGEELVDISGFHFTEGIDFTFTQGTIINPGEYIILAGDPKNHTNEGIQIFQIWEGRLDNSGEVLSLCDPENRVVDQVHFDDHYPWPREPDGEGPSLELISPALDNSLASSWKASEQTGGTPGTGKYTGVEEAGSSMDENLRLSVSPNPFHYTCKIKYALSEESQVIVKIFNGNGQELTTLVSKKQAPGNFEILWKPLDLPGGIYFIYISTEGYTRTEKVLHLNPE